MHDSFPSSSVPDLNAKAKLFPSFPGMKLDLGWNVRELLHAFILCSTWNTYLV